MRNRKYGGVRGRKTKVGEKLLRFPPTRLFYFFFNKIFMFNISFTVDKQRLIEAAFDDGYFFNK